jgi:hypothetical protein
MSNYRMLKIDSSNRDSGGTSSEFKITLPRALHKGDVFELLYAHIPQTYFNIDSTNNTFVFNEGGLDLTAVLTPGYYTTSSILVELATSLNSLGSFTYTVSLIANTQRIQITGSSAFSVVAIERSPLGFGVSTGVSLTHIGTAVLNLERHQSLSIDINDITEIEGKNHGSTFIIPSDQDLLVVLEYTPKTSFTQQVNITSDSKVLSVRLKDKDNKTIELHGADWWFLLKAI